MLRHSIFGWFAFYSFSFYLYAHVEGYHTIKNRRVSAVAKTELDGMRVA